MPEPHFQPSEGDVAALRTLILGFRVTQLLHVAARLGIMAALGDGPLPPGALAARVHAHPGAIARVLHALASLGLLRSTPERAYELTPRGHLLRPGVPGSLHGVARLYGEEWLWHAYGRMDHSVRTGTPAFDVVHGCSLYAYLEREEDARTVFQDAMTSFSAREGTAILEAYDFTGIRVVADVGGGHGALLAALLGAYPGMTGVLLEAEHVVHEAVPLLEASGVAGRCTLLPGDFFVSVPAGADAYVLKSVLHNWEDAQALEILGRCRAAMADHTRLLVIERVVPTGDGATGSEAMGAALFDLGMLVVQGGLERTEAEYRALLERAGFALRAVLPTRSPLSLLEAVPQSGPST